MAWDEQRATTNLERIVATLRSQIEALDAQIANLREQGDAVTEEQITGRVNRRAEQQEQLYYARTLVDSAVWLLSVQEPAAVPRSPVASIPARSAGLAGAALGSFVVDGLISLRETLDTRLRDSDDSARTSGLPVLAEFPRLPEGTRRLPREAGGYLRTHVDSATPDAHPRVILITCSHQLEGKSNVAMSLAKGFARNGQRTLLVDADLRKPGLAKEYGIDERHAAPLRMGRR